MQHLSSEYLSFARTEAGGAVTLPKCHTGRNGLMSWDRQQNPGKGRMGPHRASFNLQILDLSEPFPSNKASTSIQALTEQFLTARPRKPPQETQPASSGHATTGHQRVTGAAAAAGGGKAAVPL